ncbi:hypothetical protein ACN20G_19000 [Streptomyces sp. BI20]|uniref:hypothetical protein n=1 Tax=Streptomyces sp. BI20 TaxID=3403460 RepID=UPI003C76EB9D
MSGARGLTRAARIAVGCALPAELALVVCVLAGVRIPGAVLVAAEIVVLGVLVLEAVVLGGHYRAARAAGLDRAGARRASVRAVVPPPALLLVRHELAGMGALVRWAGRRPHGVREGDHAAGYTGPQTAMVYGMLFVCVVETVVMALVIPWPVVHWIVLVLDVYTIAAVLALHAACVTRPHVVGADGSLRIRYGALFDLRLAPGDVVAARLESRFPEGRTVALGEDGVLDVNVGSQTTVTVELAGPTPFRRPLGALARTHTVRFHADDPRALLAALRAAGVPATRA